LSYPKDWDHLSGLVRRTFLLPRSPETANYWSIVYVMSLPSVPISSHRNFFYATLTPPRRRIAAIVIVVIIRFIIVLTRPTIIDRDLDVPCDAIT